jgi:hydroxypyruvate isomerase
VIFSVNISLLYTEVPFLERFGRVAEAGFGAVEFWWPTGQDVDQVVAAVASAGLEVALFNFDAGVMAAGDRGLMGHPDRRAQFRANVPVAVELARRVGCKRLNALAGLRCDDLSVGRQIAMAIDNARFAADLAADAGVAVVIEPVNTIENGPYLLPTCASALEFIDACARPNVALQYDVYHAQRSEGNLVATIRALYRRIAHVQIADSPDRHEPGTGEIAYPFVLRALAETGYDGYVGLEYKPRSATEAAVAWIPESERSGHFAVEALFPQMQSAR